MGAYTTVVEAVTVLRVSERADGVSMTDHNARDEPDEITVAFERCFERLDLMIQAYRTYSKELVPRLSREQLPPLIPFATRPALGPPRWDGLSLFLIHFNVGAFAEDELNADARDALNLYLEALSRDHPFVLFSEWSLDAEIAFRVEGRFGDCIVDAETAVETLLDALLSVLLWEDSVDPEEAAREAFSMPFARRVRTQFPPRLGGDWRTRGGRVLTRWYEDLARVRHRVVHSGYRPSREEAAAGMDAAAEVESFVRGRVLDRRDDYPRTTLILLARPGLERAGLWQGNIRRFAEEVADTEPGWFESIRSWREAVDEALNR
jgi:hypothetical protein